MDEFLREMLEADAEHKGEWGMTRREAFEEALRAYLRMCDPNREPIPDMEEYDRHLEAVLGTMLGLGHGYTFDDVEAKMAERAARYREEHPDEAEAYDRLDDFMDFGFGYGCEGGYTGGYSGGYASSYAGDLPRSVFADVMRNERAVFYR